MQITVTFRDMYLRGTDSVILEGKLAETFIRTNATQRAVILSKLETVSFKHIYDIKIKR